MIDSIDLFDKKILQILQNDASMTTREIGKLINLSHSSVNKRIQKMRDTGVIRKFTIDIDPDKIGLNFMTFTHVQLKDHSKETLSYFQTEIIKHAEVLECHHMSGSHDFILRIITKDHREYHEVLMNKVFGTLGVGNIETKLVMSTAKSASPLPIALKPK